MGDFYEDQVVSTGVYTKDAESERRKKQAAKFLVRKDATDLADMLDVGAYLPKENHG
jgi:hypothetical protein